MEAVHVRVGQTFLEDLRDAQSPQNGYLLTLDRIDGFQELGVKFVNLRLGRIIEKLRGEVFTRHEMPVGNVDDRVRAVTMDRDRGDFRQALELGNQRIASAAEQEWNEQDQIQHWFRQRIQPRFPPRYWRSAIKPTQLAALLRVKTSPISLYRKPMRLRPLRGSQKKNSSVRSELKTSSVSRMIL